MKKLIASTALLVVTALPVAQVQAQETGAGCGIGAAIMEGKSGKGAQIVAGILNNLILPATFFMTTGDGMMGCDPTQTVKRDEVTEIFVASNMDQLSTEVAQGGGDYLNVLAELMGIAEEDKAAFQQVAQQNYDQLFLTDGSAKSVIQSIETAMLAHDNLAKYSVN